MKAREKILVALKDIKEQDPQLWSTMRTIARKSGVSQNYTHHVVEDLVFESIVEKGTRRSHTYYRLIQTNPE